LVILEVFSGDIMQTINSTLQEQQKAGRGIVILSRAFFVDDDSKRIVLDRFNLEDSLKKMIAWADKPPRKHGKFYLYDLTRKQKETCSQYLDDRFVTIEG
jgi:hypothetical protein